MTPVDHSTLVSLPSIHEMFPELDFSHSEPRQLTPTGDQRRPDCTTTNDALSHNSDGIHHSPDIRNDTDRLRCPHPITPLPKDLSPKRSRSQAPYTLRGRPSAPVSSNAREPPCPPNVLKPHSVTTELVKIASRGGDPCVYPKTHQRTSRAAFDEDSSTELTVISIQKARPTFRVHLSSSRSSEYDLSDGFDSPMGRSVKINSNYSSLPFSSTLSPDPTSQTYRHPQQHPFQQHSLMQDTADDKKHCCPHCEKRFNRPSSLNIHVNTHTGAKPFQCPFPGCSRKFNVNSNMRRHYRNHVSSRQRELTGPAHLAKIQHPYPSLNPSDTIPSYSLGESSPQRVYAPRSRSSSLSALDEDEDVKYSPAVTIQECGPRWRLGGGGGSPPVEYSSPMMTNGSETSRHQLLSSVSGCSQEDALRMLANVTECLYDPRSRPRC